MNGDASVLVDSIVSELNDIVTALDAKDHELDELRDALALVRAANRLLTDLDAPIPYDTADGAANRFARALDVIEEMLAEHHTEDPDCDVEHCVKARALLKEAGR